MGKQPPRTPPQTPPRTRPPDAVAPRMTKPGDAIEVHGEPNAWGGRPVAARIERRPGGYVAVRPGNSGPAPAVRTVLADALADLPAEDAERDGWEFVASG